MFLKTELVSESPGELFKTDIQTLAPSSPLAPAVSFSPRLQESRVCRCYGGAQQGPVRVGLPLTQRSEELRQTLAAAPRRLLPCTRVRVPSRPLTRSSRPGPFLSSPPFQPLGRTLPFKPGQGPLGSWLALLVWQRLSWGSSQGSNRRRPLSSSFSSQSWHWLVLIRPFTPGHADSSNSGCRYAFLILPCLPGHPVSLPLRARTHTHTHARAHTHFHKKIYLALHSSADSVSE